MAFSCGLLLCGSLLGRANVSADDEEKDAIYYNRLLGRGVNFANALEAPKEGEWGVKLEADFFKKIQDAGFNAVRVPIRWSAHARTEAPYEIDATFFERIDWVVEQALSHKLAVVLNVHHYEEMDKDPAKHLPRLLALWKQIAAHYRDRPDRVYFELYNEPHDGLTDERWQEVLPELLKVIRESNPRRMVIVGPANWNSLDHLEKLRLPKEDRRLIATFHYYSPFEFTHQGAEWVKDSQKWKGKTWTGTPKEKEALEKDFAKAAAWAKKNDRPLYLGEFGAYEAADMESRARWTRAVAREAEKHGFSWAYWDFCAGFGAYDSKAKVWRQPLLKALLDKE
jgi:endoglucanase